MPRGSWDCQAHIFGPFRKFPLNEGRGYTPEEFPIEQYIELLNILGFDHGVVVQGGAHGTDNRAMLDGIAREPERLRGVAVIRPGRPDSELEGMRKLGVRGVRMSTQVDGGVPFDSLPQLAEEAAPLGWHVKLHFLHAVELLDIEDYLMSCPAKIVFDHMARITGEEGASSAPFQSLLRLLETGNCWVMLSSLYRLSSLPYPHEDMLPMVHKIVAERPDRIIWGSNWPHPVLWKQPMPNDADLVDLIPLWVPAAATQKRMLVDNPLDLYR